MATAPADPPRLYLNEHLSPELARALRQQRVDALSCLEVGMGGKGDEVQLAYAIAQKRAVVSFNHRHFAPLFQQYLENGKDHWGIVLSTDEPFRVLYRRLLRLADVLSADELKNQLRWLNEFK